MISEQISILTEDVLDEAVDLIIERLEYYVEVYGYTSEDFDEAFVQQVADEVGVKSTPQVENVVLYRAEQMFE